ncbi:hypothetical protein JOC55_001847 [Paenibacillus sacheonensis]|nr:hypothetical protein [Paenibacillus sacheonensis]
MKNKLILFAIFGSGALMLGALIWLLWIIQRI